MTRTETLQPDEMPGYKLPVYDYVAPQDLRTGAEPIHPVVVVGGGLAGLSSGLMLGRRGIETVILDEDNTVGAAGLSSRGICYAKRTLEICDHLGLAPRMMAKGITWNEGRVYLNAHEVYRFDLQPDRDQKFPAFINLQQFYVEEYLVDAVTVEPKVDMRWKHRVIGVEVHEDHVAVRVETPDGPYTVRGRYLLACDGGHSTIRDALGCEDESATYFEDRWCIADIRMEVGDVIERRFWIDADFANGGAAILHLMADGIWRSDWQIGHLDDPDSHTTPEAARQRLAGMLGRETDYELVWVGPWRFKNRLMKRFDHGRVLFVGDSAHELPPFGARGGNSGIQDADNLAWKLAYVLEGRLDPSVLATYGRERKEAALKNIRIATRSALFISPETAGQRLFRNAALALADSQPWAQPAVNTGRLSTPTTYEDTALNGAEDGRFERIARVGAAAPDGVVEADGVAGYLIDHLSRDFTALYFVDAETTVDGPVPAHAEPAGLPMAAFAVLRPGVAAPPGLPAVVDPSGRLFERYGAAGGALYVLRPDGHIIGRSRTLDAATAVAMVEGAIEAATSFRSAAE